MNINIIGKHIDVTQSLKELIIKKLHKLDKYFDDSTKANVHLLVEKERNIMEVTIFFNGMIFRAEEVSRDMYTTIDQVVKKLEKQIHHHRSKLERRLRKGAFLEDTFDGADFNEEQQVIVKHKSFPIKPLSVEEAILQMNLLSHAFFVFVNSESENVSVIYKRKDGQVGLLEPEY